jgi:hypothetical protein
MNEYWSYILGIVGVIGFLLAGQKIWWSWYINLGNQALWLAYSIITEQWGFLLATAVYTAVFARNAYTWTKEHRLEQRAAKNVEEVRASLQYAWAEKKPKTFPDGFSPVAKAMSDPEISPISKEMARPTDEKGRYPHKKGHW